MSLAAGALVAALAVGAGAPFADSLPRTDGAAVVAGLGQTVHVSRDALGIPVIRGADLPDVACGHGFVHAQDRFFQMDLARRMAAGRLAELVGPDGLGFDRRSRPFRFESVAKAVVERLPAGHRRLLQAYADGVNAGLADLAAPPPEYTFLMAKPAPWSAADCVIVQLAMFDALHFNAAIERRLGVMHEALPEALFAFLTPLRTRFEAPLLDEHAGRAVAPLRPAPIPGPEIVDLRGRAATDAGRALVDVAPMLLGSNNWAVAGGRTAHGGAIVANDPHLRLSAPGIWHRGQMEWGDERVAGVSLPGSPGIIIGATRHLAWGFTNTMGDFQDLILVEVNPDDPGQYRGPDGWEPFGEVVEEIRVRGGDPIRLALRTTRWGVVTGEDAQGRPIVLQWTALRPDMINMEILSMAGARTLEEGVAVMRSWRGPSQNVLLADTGGRIAWVVSGYLPRRSGHDGTIPVSWGRDGIGWVGPRDEAERPVIIDPPDGLLFTANNRTVPPAWSARLGNGWDLGARAGRIRDRLRALPTIDEEALLAIQLDTRVELLDFYRDLLLEVTKSAPADPLLREAREVVSAWNGTADADQPALRLLDAWREALHAAIVAPLVAPCRAIDPSFRYRWFRGEESVRRLLEVRPAHLLPPGSASWSELLHRTLGDVLTALAVGREAPRLTLPWGQANIARINHPLADAMPALGVMLNMPRQPQSGYAYAVRVATPDYGASMRMVVSPGHAERGLLHMPGGQSGHPMSPHYRDGHAAWGSGDPTPFLAGSAQTSFRLEPAG